MIKFLFAACLLGFGATFSNTQQERQYTITVPAHLANPLWLLLNGQKNKVTVEQFQELLPIVGTQFDLQDRRFYQEDSLLNARKVKADTTKIRKP
jgi:hypothetical protein